MTLRKILTMSATRRRLLAGTALLAAGLALPIGAANAQEYGGTLQVHTLGLDTSDFHRHTGSIGVPQVIVETLVSIDASGQPIPFLAESWEVSEDGRTYTFAIRQGVAFHNGRDMTAQDVLANFERIKETVEGGWLTSAMNKVDSFAAPDEQTFVITLTEPFAPLLNLLSEAWIVAPESEGWDSQITAPIGTGPFMWGEWQPQVTLYAPRFESYWQDGLPYLDAVNFDLHEVADASLALRAGDYHLATISGSKVAAVEEDDDTTVLFRKDTGWNFLSFNNRNPVPPFDNARVREAIAYALDKQALMQVIANDRGIVTNQMVIPGNFYFDEEMAAADVHAVPNLEMAAQILADEGVEPSDYTIRAISHQTDRMAVMVMQMLRQLGFEVDSQTYDDLGFQQALSGYEWDVFPGGSGPRADVFLRYVRMMSDGPNPHLWGGVQDPEYDRLVNAAISSVDAQERRDYYLQAWQRVMDNYYTLVIGHNQGAFGMRNEVHGFEAGFTYSLHGADYGVAQTWLAPSS